MNLEDKIKKNFVNLTKNLCNQAEVLIHSIQERLITFPEKELIESKPTSLERNSEFFQILMKKNIDEGLLKDMLLETENTHLLFIFESNETTENVTGVNDVEPSEEIIEQKLPDDTMFNNNEGEYITKTNNVVLNELSETCCPTKKGLQNLIRKSNGILMHEEINQVLRQGKIAVLSGKSSGVGKTFTAIEYCHHYENEYFYILWVDSRSNESIIHSFQTISCDLKLAISNNGKLETVVSACFKELEDHDVLFVFDNLIDADFEKIYNLRSYSSRFHCIITSQLFESTNTKFQIFHLDVFTRCESIEFLKSNLNDDSSEADLNKFEQLGNLLEYSPVALQVAVAIIKAEKIRLDTYLAMLSSSKMISPIEAVIQITKDFLMKNEEGKNALGLWNILASLYPSEHIELDSLTAEANGIEVNEAVLLLRQYGLITTVGKKTCNVEIRSKTFWQWIFGWLVDMGSRTFKIHIPKKSEIIYMHQLFTLTNANQMFDIVEQLRKLLSEKNYEKAAQLGANDARRNIDSSSSQYNFAICLIKNNNFKKASKIIKTLLDQIYPDEEMFQNFDKFDELIPKTSSPHWEQLAVLQIINLYKLGSIAESKALLERLYKYYEDAQNNAKYINITIILYLHLILCTDLSDCGISQISMTVHVRTKAIKFLALNDCSFHFEYFSKLNVSELSLTNIVLLDSQEEKIQNFDITSFINGKYKSINFNCSNPDSTKLSISSKIIFSVSSIALNNCILDIFDNIKCEMIPHQNRQISLANVIVKTGFLEKQEYNISSFIGGSNRIHLECSDKTTTFLVYLDALTSVRSVTMINCSLILTEMLPNPNPKYLELRGLIFQNETLKEEANDLTEISNYFDFGNLDALILEGNNISVNLNSRVFPKQIRLLHFDKVQVKNWHRSKMNVDTFITKGVVLQKSDIDVRHLQIYLTFELTDTVNIPKSIEYLSLIASNKFCKLKCDNYLSLPNLKFLEAKTYDINQKMNQSKSFLECLNAPKLCALTLRSMSLVIDKLPKSVKTLTLANVNLKGSNSFSLETLCIKNYSSEICSNVEKILSCFIPQNLIFEEIKSENLDKVKKMLNKYAADKRMKLEYNVINKNTSVTLEAIMKK